MPISDANPLSLHNYFLSRQNQVLDLTRRLVELESPTGDESGSRAVVALLADEAKSITGLRVERLHSPNYGEHLRITAFEGAGSPVVILGHTDTVHPRGSLSERPWRVQDGKAFGPGVFDMKASCAMGVEVIRALTEVSPQPNRQLTLLLTCDEETGSITGRQLVEDAARNARAVLVLEPPAPGGRVKTGRKGTGIFTIEVRGRAAHAGLEPEKGASAILELARQTERLHSLNDPSSGIRVNVGLFHGGTLSNVVPAEAHAQVDVRFGSMEECRYIENEIHELKPFDDRVKIIVKGGINRPPLERSQKVLELYRRALTLANGLGMSLEETQVGGASDGNFAAAAGAAVLDGLGIEGDGAHATHEHILVDNIAVRGALIAALVASL